jgi:hypothetical protein
MNTAATWPCFLYWYTPFKYLITLDLSFTYCKDYSTSITDKMKVARQLVINIHWMVYEIQTDMTSLLKVQRLNKSHKWVVTVGQPNFDSRKEHEIFSSPHPASIHNGHHELFSGVNLQDRDADHSLPSSVEVLECVEICLHSLPFNPSWRCA